MSDMLADKLSGLVYVLILIVSFVLFFFGYVIYTVKQNKYSKDRSFTANLILFILSLVGLLVIPSIISLFLRFKNVLFSTIIADFIYIGILYLMYRRDLNEEAKIYFKDFKNNFKYSFKIYILGYMAMIFFNLIIYMVLKDISSNETQVREMLYNNTFLTMINIVLIAPISEEIIFRKSLRPIFNNRWLYVIVSGLLFGGAHILTNIINNAFTISDLLYVLPYGCLGASFALMDYNSKTTFSSMVIHCLHNTITAILLLITYFGGK